MVKAEAADSCAARSPRRCAPARKTLIDPKSFPNDKPGTPYMAPQVVVDVDHQMSLMREESFGPVVGIMAGRATTRKRSG